MEYSIIKARQGVTSSHHAMSKVVVISTSLAFVVMLLLANSI